MTPSLWLDIISVFLSLFLLKCTVEPIRHHVGYVVLLLTVSNSGSLLIRVRNFVSYNAPDYQVQVFFISQISLFKG